MLNSKLALNSNLDCLGGKHVCNGGLHNGVSDCYLKTRVLCQMPSKCCVQLNAICHQMRKNILITCNFQKMPYQRRRCSTHPISFTCSLNFAAKTSITCPVHFFGCISWDGIVIHVFETLIWCIITLMTCESSHSIRQVLIRQASVEAHVLSHNVLRNFLNIGTLPNSVSN